MLSQFNIKKCQIVSALGDIMHYFELGHEKVEVGWPWRLLYNSTWT